MTDVTHADAGRLAPRRAAPTEPPTIWCYDPPPVPAWATEGPLRSARQRRLPRWLPLAVLICAPFAVAEPLAAIAVFPKIGVAAIAVFVAVAVAVRWVAQGAVSAGGRAVAVAGVGWGATVATTATLAAAGFIAAGPGVDDTTYITVVGPFIEEAAKAAFVLWALWRIRAVTSALDGIVCAWWCAAGFAVIENVGYFYNAELSGNLATVIVVRGVASPFAHLLFGTVVGAAAGYAASRCWPARRTVSTVGAAVVAAAFIHGAWNQIAISAIEGGLDTAAIVATVAAAVGFVVLFWSVALVVAVTRDAEVARIAATNTAAVAAHPSLTAYDDRTVTTVATLMAADIDADDEAARQRRIAAALRTEPPGQRQRKRKQPATQD